MTPAAASRAKKPSAENGNGTAPEQDTNRRIVINTLAPERGYAVIDDERHEYRLIQEFGARDRHELNRLVDEYQKLSTSQKKLSNEQAKRLDWLIEWLFDHLLLKPEKLREQLKGENPETGLPRLTGSVKEAVIDAFFDTPEARAMQRILSTLATMETQDDSSTSTS